MNYRANRSAPDEELFTSIRLSPIASVITDPRLPDNPVVAANAAFSQLTGYDEAEIVGRNCRFLAGEETSPAAQAVLRHAILEARPALAHMLNYRKDGIAFWNAVMIAPVLSGEGQVAYFLGSQMDIGEGASALASRQSEAALRIAELTPRQRQVLSYMIAGYRNKQTAGFLGIDEKTVKMHRAGLLARLGVRSSASAVRIGVEAGLGLSDPG
jgi:PAS domain S-box-containing protein